MADVKITALTAISSNPVNPATFPIPMVDLLDNTITASGTTKKVTVNQILGAGGTATLASATITGAATVGTTLGVTGVATFASSISAVDDATVSNAGRLTLGSAAGNAGARLDLRGWSSGNANWRLSSAFYGNGLDFTPSTTAGGTTFTTPAFSMLSSGDLSMALGNVVMATPGKGIDFSATASGSGTMTSELLNDYEEGTWTGTLTGGTTNPTTPVTATGRYTKIGRVVTVQISFSNANTVGASGLIGITGLPFACNNSSSSSNGSVSFYSIATFTGSPFVSIGVNESFLNFFSNISNAAFGNVTHNAGAAGNYLTASITYTV